ncbi:MAG TPA: hypothetical protein VMU45_03710 [Candidatus Eisenbacteria bacterium]|nr:hypothetical protein [Candidatus Eisenbacteria bacterium]
MNQGKQKKQVMHYRWHAGPPTDVRFDLQKSDSLVAPYTGIVEFTIHAGMTHWWPTPEQALADDCVSPLFCIDQPHRHVFRVGPKGAELQYRLAFDNSKGQWFQEEGAPSYCWEAIGYK